MKQHIFLPLGRLAFLLVLVCLGTSLPGQNRVLNPSFENGPPIPIVSISPGIKDIDQSSGPDYCPDYSFGCPPPAGVNTWTIRNQTGLNNFSQPISPHSGDKCTLGFLHANGTGNATSDERIRGNFDVALQHGAYEFSAWHAALDNVFGASGEGYLEFWLINSANACGPQDKLVHEVYFHPTATWTEMRTCFSIGFSEDGLYDQFEFRMRRGNPLSAVHNQLLLLDDLSVTSLTYIPGFTDLGPIICEDDLILDVSQLGPYTIQIIPGDPNPCVYQGNGQVQPYLDLRSFCTITCDTLPYILTLIVECDRVVYGWGTKFIVECPPDVDLGPDIEICENDIPPVLQAPPGFASYVWTVNGQSPICFGTPTQISACEPGTWCLTATTANGCQVSDCVEVTYVPCCVPDPPAFFSCQIIAGELYLTWAAVPGAVSYQVHLQPNDPSCGCPGPMGFIDEYLVTEPKVGPIPNKCFSWRVRSVCPPDIPSAWSGWNCHDVTTATCLAIGKQPDEKGLNAGAGSLVIQPHPAHRLSTVRLTLVQDERVGFEIWDLTGQKLVEIPGTYLSAGVHQLDVFRGVALRQGSYVLKAVGKELALSKVFVWVP